MSAGCVLDLSAEEPSAPSTSELMGGGRLARQERLLSSK